MDNSGPTKPKKKKRVQRQRYRHDWLLFTLRNTLVAKVQESILHPYPVLAKAAEEAVPVIRQALYALATPVTKNAALNILARLPTETAGGAAIIPVLRTYITAARLHTKAKTSSIEDARTLCAIGESASQADEAGYWAFVRHALEVLEQRGRTEVGFEALCDLSRTRVM